MRYLNSKAQEEAPFQMLLAVAMLAMVLPLAMYLFQQFQEWQCRARIQNNMESFAREMELAATLGGGQRFVDVDLRTYACGNFRVDNFTLERPTQDRCLELCHEPNCWVMHAKYMDYSVDPPEESIATEPVCIRIPFNVEITTESCGGYEEVGNIISTDYHTFVFEKIGNTVTMCELPRQR